MCKYHQDTDDISFQYLVAGSNEPVTGIIQFVGNDDKTFHPLDFNFDGKVSLPDYATFLANYSISLTGKTAAEQYNLGDLDRDGKHTVRDFVQFQQLFKLVRVADALAAGVEIPEPTAALMLALAVVLVGTTRRRAWPLAIALVVAGLGAPSAIGAPLNETFEGITLLPSVEENPTPGVWSDVGPRGWKVDRSGVPGYTQGSNNDGVKEWAGWTFANKDWWVASADDQDRSLFTKASGTVLIADDDEWDDANHPKESYYSTYITTPRLDVLPGVAAGQVRLMFDSSWRPEGFDDWILPGQTAATNNQTATVEVSYNGGPFQNIFTWDSKTGSPTFHDYNVNESVDVSLNYNGAPNTSLQVRFGLLNAANDWWWAMDNIKVNNVNVIVPVSPTLRIDTTSGLAEIVGAGIAPEMINSIGITSVNGNLGPQGNVGLSFSKPDSVDGPDADSIVGNNIGESWQLASSGANAFTEFFLDGNSPYVLGRTDSLGRIFNPATSVANRDVAFTYTTVDGEVLPGPVQYVTIASDADFNNSGTVDGADFLIWQRNNGGAGTNATGDADGDGDVDATDLVFWKQRFGQAPAVAAGTSVPEPMPWYWRRLAPSPLDFAGVG